MANQIRNKNQTKGFAVTEFVILAVVLSAITASLLGVSLDGNPPLGKQFLGALELIYNTISFVLSLP
jgi:hypothetical protein